MLNLKCSFARVDLELAFQVCTQCDSAGSQRPLLPPSYHVSTSSFTKFPLTSDPVLVGAHHTNHNDLFQPYPTCLPVHCSRLTITDHFSISFCHPLSSHHHHHLCTHLCSPATSFATITVCNL